jgi:hypothetical protein
VDSAGNVLLLSLEDGQLFLYSPAGVTTPVVPWPSADALLLADMSLDGRVIVGATTSQAVRRVDSTNTLLGPLQPTSSSRFNATNGDGSVAVGRDSFTPLRWTASTGMKTLGVLSNWVNVNATDVSTDGKVVVGWASADWEILGGQIPVKWSGASLTPTELSPLATPAGFAVAAGVNLDGSVIVGTVGSVATLWDSAGAHSIKSLIGATPDLTSDWTLGQAVAVSDDGKFVVGTGTYYSNSQAWVVHLP